MSCRSKTGGKGAVGIKGSSGGGSSPAVDCAPSDYYHLVQYIDAQFSTISPLACVPSFFCLSNTLKRCSLQVSPSPRPFKVPTPRHLRCVNNSCQSPIFSNRRPRGRSNNVVRTQCELPMVRTHERSPSPTASADSLLKRLKTTHTPSSSHEPDSTRDSAIAQFADGVLSDPGNIQKLHTTYMANEPFKFCVLDELFQDGLLRNVKDECLKELSFTEKETDIYKVRAFSRSLK